MPTSLMRILVIDDHEDIAEWLADELRVVGYQAQTAYDGTTALALASSFVPHAMLVDIALPGMNGWEIARRVRKLDLTHCPRLIALSAFDQEIHRDRSTAAGFERHLVKPVKLPELLQLLAEPPSAVAPAR